MSHPPAGDAEHWLLRCHACGRTLDITLDDVCHFVASDWPLCCKETMTLYTPTVLPDVAPPAPDRPS